MFLFYVKHLQVSVYEWVFSRTYKSAELQYSSLPYKPLDMPRFPVHLLSLTHSVTIPNTHLRFLRREVGSFASRVLTNPKSCITLSSWRRSSWPFRRNTNSCPLLPEKGLTGKSLLPLSKHWRVNTRTQKNWEVWQSDWPDYRNGNAVQVLRDIY